MTDQELLLQYVRTGDQNAFKELVQRYIGLVHGIARRQMAAEADDVTQAVFWLLAQRAGQVQRHPAIAGWLFRVTMNTCARVRRSARRRQIHEREAGQRMNTDRNAEQHDELARKLDAALALLPQRYREVLLLRYLQGRSLEETGMQLGLSPAATAQCASRGLERLRRRFMHAGYALDAGGVVALMAAESAKAAPQGLIHAVSAGALTGGHAAAASAIKAAVLAPGWGKTAALGSAKVAALLALALAGSGVVALHFRPAMANAPAALPAPAAAPADAALDQAGMPGDTCIAVFEAIVDADGTTALRDNTRRIDANTRFFELRQGATADVRKTLNNLADNGQIIAVRGDLPHGRVRGAPHAENWRDNHASQGVDEDQRNIHSTIALQTNYLLATADGPAARLKLDADGVTAHLQVDGAEPLDKLAAIHWSDKVNPGQTLILAGDWGDWGGTHIVDIRFIEIFKATPMEQRYLDGLPPWRWVRGGAAALRGLADRSMVWAARGDLSAGGLGVGPWSRHLSDGTIVELLAIARPMDWPMCWWDPDGRPHPYVCIGWNITEGLTPRAATVRIHPRILSPGLERDDRVDDLTAVDLGDEKRIEVYVGTGPWKEQPITEDRPVTLGTGAVTMTSVRRVDGGGRRGGRGGGFVLASLEGDPGLGIEARLALVTGDHQHIVSANTDQRIRIQPGPMSDSTGFLETFEIAPSRADHFVLLSRPREKVIFENFPLEPRIPIPEKVTAQEVASANQQLTQNMDREFAQWWTAAWKERSADLAALDAIPRAAATPAGAMRIMLDKALAGDADGVGAYLAGPDPYKTAFAQCLAAYGQALARCEKQFGGEAMAREAWRISAGPDAFPFPAYYALRLPAEDLLASSWTVDQDRASNGSAVLTLVLRDGQWRFDLEHWLQQPPIRGQALLRQAERAVAESKALEADLQAGKISAAQAAERLRTMNPL